MGASTNKGKKEKDAMAKLILAPNGGHGNVVQVVRYSGGSWPVERCSNEKAGGLLFVTVTGLNRSIYCIRSIPWGLAFGKICLKSMGCFFSMLLI